MSALIGKFLGAFSRKTEPEAASETTGAMDVDKPSKSSKKRLFDDEEDADEDSDSAGAPPASIGKSSSFGINKEFAERYEHNKKREEKQKLEEKYGNDSDSESSSDDGTEDEDGYLLTEDLDARMSEALQAIKSKDPRVYKTDAKFFDAAEAEKAGLEAAAKAAPKDTKEKPVYLRDYHRERLLRGDIGADDDDDDEDNNDDGGASLQPKTYQEEQDDLKQALIDEMNAADDSSKDGSADDDSDDDAFIKPKASSKASKAVAASTGVHPSRAGRIQISKIDVESADKNPELFLSNFMASRAWVPEGDDKGPGWEAFDSEDEDGETGVDRAEEFESAYNMRFEDPTKSNEVLKSYSRTVVADRSVRRSEKSARQRQRDQERERQAAEKQARREERARLRKIKVDQAHEKLAKIKKAAGIAGRQLTDEEWMSMLDDAWDNDAWENQMKKQFGEEYYAEKDAEMAGKEDGADSDEAGEEDEEEEEADSSSKKKADKKKKLPKKPKWDDDIDIKDIIPDFEDEEAAPKAALSSGDEEEDDEEEEEGDDHQSKRRKTGKEHKKDRAEAKRDARRERARIEALVDRQMALDDPTLAAPAGPSTGVNVEGVSGFRYRETSPQTFGLTARDILLAPSDTVLNEFAGLKKLATFRDEERKRKDRKKLGKKARLRQWRRDTFGAEYTETGPTYGFERFIDEDAGSNAAPSSSKGKSKDKGKEKSRPDASAEAAGKKKRKRAGRSGGKSKEAGKAEAE